jgi:hypothetical protein
LTEVFQVRLAWLCTCLQHSSTSDEEKKTVHKRRENTTRFTI